MKIKSTLIFFLYLSNFIISQNLFANYENKILIKIENELITSYDVKNKILSNLILSNQEITQENINNQKKQALDSLMQFKLKKIELSKYNIEDDNNQINKYLNAVSSNNVQNLKKKFNDNNLNFDLYLEEVKTQFKWQKFIYKKYAREISIDDNSINIEIEKIMKNKRNIEEYNLSEIEILNKNNIIDKEKILNISEQIAQYGFEITASKFSESSSASNNGKLGWLNANSLSKEIDNIIKKMKIGETSKPIKRQNSVIFLKLNNKRVSKVENIDLNELKQNIINQKTNELFRLYSISYLSKLKNTVVIEYL